MLADPLGLAISGRWLETPNIANFGANYLGYEILEFNGLALDTGWGPNDQYLDPFLFWNWARVHFSLTGDLRFKVECFDDDECSSRRWTIGAKISLEYIGHTDVGIFTNTLGWASGRMFGLPVGIAVSLAMFEFKFAYVAYTEAQGLNTLAEKYRADILAKGPTAICRGGIPPY